VFAEVVLYTAGHTKAACPVARPSCKSLAINDRQRLHDDENRKADREQPITQTRHVISTLGIRR